MSLRVFRDHGGQEWKVWDVKPYLTGAREERRRVDRRRDASLLTPGLEAGWLCFENRMEKRRLTPIPGGWQEAPEPQLEELLGHARRVPRRLLAPDQTD
jgi:hypothetical protein